MKKQKAKPEWPKPSLKELGEIHGIDPLKIKWARIMQLKEIQLSFPLHRNTLNQLLRDQVIVNQQLSPRRWRVAVHEFPDGFGI